MKFKEYADILKHFPNDSFILDLCIALNGLEIDILLHGVNLQREIMISNRNVIVTIDIDNIDKETKWTYLFKKRNRLFMHLFLLKRCSVLHNMSNDNFRYSVVMPLQTSMNRLYLN